MRSVNRGPWPTGNDGCPISFPEYSYAKDHLTKRIGEYCSYCERKLSVPHVEHVIPKSLARDLETEWSNLLLGCVNCNGCKSKRNHSRDGYLWPDRDNTFGAFVYQSSGDVFVNETLVEEERSKASALFDLVGLGKRETRRDTRHRQRRQAWNKAIQARDRGHRNKSSDWRDWAVDVALGTGFFSVWMAVFHDDEDMRQRLTEAFPGTRPG